MEWLINDWPFLSHYFEVDREIHFTFLCLFFAVTEHGCYGCFLGNNR